MIQLYSKQVTKILFCFTILFNLQYSFSQVTPSPSTMTFGTSTISHANSNNPSIDHSVSSLLNGFDMSASGTGIILAFAVSGNDSGTDAIGGSAEAVLSWIGDAADPITSGTLTTDSGNEIGLTSMQFAYEQALGGSTMNFTISGMRDGSEVGTIVLTSPNHNSAISIDFTSPTTGSFINIDQLIITPASSFFGGFSIDDLIVVTASSNTDPTININNSTLVYTEGNAATQIDATSTVNDSDGDSDWDGGTLTAQITANNEAADELSISDADGDGTAITVSGTNILADGTDIGDLSVSGGIVTNGTMLTITFDSDATNANVQEVLQSLRYRNTSSNPGTSNRTITFTTTDKNAGSANDTRTISVIAAPDITNIVVPASATYKANDNLDFTVIFNENITVNTTGGTPQLAITIGATVRQAVYQSGSTTSALLFRYVVQAGDNDTDGIVIGTLDDNNGTLQNSAGTNAILTLNGVGNTTAVLVDTTVPVNPVVTTPATTITVNSATQTLSGTHTENGVTVHAYLDSNNDGNADNLTSLGSSVVSGNTWSFSVTLMQNTTNNFVVSAKDNAGNTSNYIDVPTVTETNAITWTGTTNNDWSTASNWNTNNVPVSSSNVTIPNGLTNYPTISSAVTVNSITINSGASLIANAAVTGNVTYKRTLTTNWHLVSSPVNGETVQDLIANHTFANQGGSNITMAPYNNNGTAWNYYTSGSSANINAGTGLSAKLAAAGDLSFTGTLNSSNVPYNITQGSPNNYNLVGNPFTSYINLGTFFTDNNGKFSEGTVWMWNQAANKYDLKMSVADASFQIAPGQGFFISAGSNTSINFNTANQSHQTDTFQRSSRTEINLIASENGKSKSTKIYYVNGATKGFDFGYDGSMFSTSNRFALYSQLVSENQGKNYAIQSLPINEIENIAIPIGLNAKAGKKIDFSITSNNLPNNTKVYLEDRANNKFIDITDTNYSITIKNDINGIGRFYLRTSSEKLDTPVATLIEDVSFYKSAPNTLSVAGLQSQKASLKIYSLIGQKVVDQNFKSNGFSTITIPSVSAGVYIVELSSELGKISKKIVLE